jgi:cobalamin biosynthesis Mg chelatase CobN
MKRCTTCNRAFDDDALTVCPDDGGVLTGAGEAPQDYGALGGKATWNPSQDQLAEIQRTVAAITKPRRKSWRWVVVAILVLLILIGLFGAIVMSRL